MPKRVRLGGEQAPDRAAIFFFLSSIIELPWISPLSYLHSTSTLIFACTPLERSLGPLARSSKNATMSCTDARHRVDLASVVTTGNVFCYRVVGADFSGTRNCSLCNLEPPSVQIGAEPLSCHPFLKGSWMLAGCFTQLQILWDTPGHAYIRSGADCIRRLHGRRLALAQCQRLGLLLFQAQARLS